VPLDLHDAYAIGGHTPAVHGAEDAVFCVAPPATATNLAVGNVSSASDPSWGVKVAVSLTLTMNPNPNPDSHLTLAPTLILSLGLGLALSLTYP